jgi:hypothetical protein
MADSQLTIEQFGAEVKKKYPAYASKPDAEVGKAMLAKYPEYQSRIKKPGFWSSYDAKVAPLVEMQPHQAVHSAGDLLREVGRGVGNIGAGGLGVLLHPIDTAVGVGESIVHPITAATTIAKQLREHPLETIETGIGQAGATAGLGEAGEAVAGKVADVAPKTVGSVLRRFAGTGPKVTSKLVEDAKATNAAADAYSNLQAKIETARENALKEGNKKYSAVNASLNPIQADPEFMAGALADATEALKGSHAEPTLLKQIVAKQQRGDPFTYEDLQGDYSRLGKELSKGTLPGDEFHAYDVLHEKIGEEMQRIADSEGMGAELKAARDYWRRMKQTFGKPYNATDAASSVLQHASPELAQQAAAANRIRLLGSFDPEIPEAYQNLVKGSAKAKATGLEPGVPGETRKISPEDIRARKAKSAIVAKAPGVIRGVGYRLGALWPLLDAVRDAVKGEVPSVGGLLGGTAVVAGGAHLLSSLLENPRVVDFLTKATPEDVAQVPPELRGDLPQIVNAAKNRGVKISPAFYAAAGAVAPKQRPGDILRQAQ